MKNLGVKDRHHRIKERFEKTKIQALVAKGKLLIAMDIILEHLDSDQARFYHQALLISMELHHLEEAIMEDRISWKKESKTRNKLTRRILKLVEAMAGGQG